MSYIGNTVTTQGFTPAIDYFNGDGSTTAFTLSRPVASVAQVQVVVNNVPQLPGTAYTVSGSTITFTGAPSSGTSNIYVYYTSPITQVIAPSQGTVGTSAFASSTGSGAVVLQTSPTITTPTLSGDTTAGTINGITVGKGGGTVSTNTAVGASALNSNTTGQRNVALGYQAGYSVTTDTNNLFVGHKAGYAFNAASGSNTNNTFIGFQSGQGTTTGQNNTYVGYAAGPDGTSTGSQNTALGVLSLYTVGSGNNNTAIGYNALQNTTTGSSNVAIGYQAGYALTTGSYNILIGYQTASSGKTGGVDCIYIGRTISANNTNANGELVINTNGNNVTGKGDGTGLIATGGSIYQQNNSSSWATTSDRRLKKNIVDNTKGLEKINQICVRNFEYRLPEEVTELDSSTAVDISGVQLGVIAQELQAVLPECVKQESTGVLSVDPDNLTWYMVNAIKELKAIVDAQAVEIEALKGAK